MHSATVLSTPAVFPRFDELVGARGSTSTLLTYYLPLATCYLLLATSGIIIIKLGGLLTFRQPLPIPTQLSGLEKILSP